MLLVEWGETVVIGWIRGKQQQTFMFFQWIVPGKLWSNFHISDYFYKQLDCMLWNIVKTRKSSLYNYKRTYKIIFLNTKPFTPNNLRLKWLNFILSYFGAQRARSTSRLNESNILAPNVHNSYISPKTIIIIMLARLHVNFNFWKRYQYC